MSKKDLRSISKLRSLHDCYQNLYDAQAKGDRVRIKVWKDVIAKLEKEKADRKE